MCLLRLYQKYPEVVTPEVWNGRLKEMLTSDVELGVLSGYVSFATGLVKQFGVEQFPAIRKAAILALARVCITPSF